MFFGGSRGRHATTGPWPTRSLFRLDPRVTEQMREHYSTVGMDEKRAAVASVLRLLPGRESVDNGADAGTPANDTEEAGAANVAN